MNNKNSLVTEFYFPEWISDPIVPECMKRDLPYMVDSHDEYVINLSSQWHKFTRGEIEKRVADITEHLQHMSNNWPKRYEYITSWGCDNFLEIFGTEKCHERSDIAFVITAAIIRDELSRRDRIERNSNPRGWKKKKRKSEEK